jgi:NAD(P)H-hydrate epimerase
LLFQSTAVIDALFGTGKVRPLTGIYAQVLDKVAEAKHRKPVRIISLDLPSGLDANTGAVDSHTLFADDTITLGFPKVGLFNFPGAESVGRLSVVDIGIPSRLAENITVELLTDSWAKYMLPKRPLSANKGTFGRVLVIAGSINYLGAAYLACQGAMRVGAGLVTLATAASLQPVLASKLTEVTYLPLPESQSGIISLEAFKPVREHLPEYDVLLAGCGLGQSQSVADFLSALLSEKKLPRLVLDADALNILAKTPTWWQKLPGDVILTPHPGEMARLANMTIEAIQSNRLGVAQKMAQKWQRTVVLKGAYTVAAEPGGQARISPFANPGLASAGTGDVLSGAITGLLGQGLSYFDAAALGVYLHGKAGEMVKAKLGDTGMVASDLLPELPLAIKRLKEQ